MGYFKESYRELVGGKVSWPTWSSLQSSAVLVMVASLILSIIIATMDISFENIMKLLFPSVSSM